MKKLNCKELEIVNGGADETEGATNTSCTITEYSKDGVSVVTSRNDWNGMVDQNVPGSTKKFTRKEIKG